MKLFNSHLLNSKILEANSTLLILLTNPKLNTPHKERIMHKKKKNINLSSINPMLIIKQNPYYHNYFINNAINIEL